jgi:hypothetical protein
MYKGRLLFKYLILGIISILIYAVLRPGIYYGAAQVNCTFLTSNRYTSLRVDAETEPRWYWIKPRNHSYNDVIFSVNSSKCIRGNLQTGTWGKGTDSGKLDIPGLARMINPKEPLTPEYRRQLQSILENLNALHKGTFYLPRHYPYHFDKPINMQCSHFTPGSNYGFWGLLIWIGIWPVCMVFSKRPQNDLTRSPVKVFVITILIVVFINTALVLVWKLFSPGPVSEIIECVISLVNSPSSLILGYSLGWFADTGLAAFVWGIIVSAIFGEKAEAGCRANGSGTPGSSAIF